MSYFLNEGHCLLPTASQLLSSQCITLPPTPRRPALLTGIKQSWQSSKEDFFPSQHIQKSHWQDRGVKISIPELGPGLGQPVLGQISSHLPAPLSPDFLLATSYPSAPMVPKLQDGPLLLALQPSVGPLPHYIGLTHVMGYGNGRM